MAARGRTPSATRDNAVAARAVAAVRRTYHHIPGLVSIHWGTRYKRGRRTSDACVVVFVRTKRQPASVDREHHLPSTVTIKVAGRNRRVRVDVQALGHAGVLHVSGLEIGANALVNLDAESNAPEGTLSAIVSSRSARRVVFSGHVARRSGRGVWGRASDGTAVALGSVDAVINNATIDVAWTSDIAAAADALGRPAASVRDPMNLDVNTRFIVLVSWDFRGIPAFVDGVGVSAVFRSNEGDVVMDGLTALAGGLTNPGDSGTPVVDSNGVLVGFVVGIQGGKTFVMPAKRAFDALENL